MTEEGHTAPASEYAEHHHIEHTAQPESAQPESAHPEHAHAVHQHIDKTPDVHHGPAEDAPLPGKDFESLGLDRELVESLAKHKIVAPTRVQEQVIPLVIQRRDILCQSETGSGKTIGFALPIIQQLHGHGGARVLVVAPTRELAKQIAGEFRKFSREKQLNIVTVYGGVSMNPQVDAIPDADVVVGTPGRLLDLHRQGFLKLDLVQHLVLDECDRMFDMGFIDDILSIIAATPPGRQMLLFSATISDQIRQLTSRYMQNPINIRVDPYLLRGKLNQVYYVLEPNVKVSALVHLLKQHAPGTRTLVFCRTKRMTDTVARALRHERFNADCINGDMSQVKRERVMEDFSRGKMEILVATDVAARGLHIDDVRFVINYDLPEELETYIHRIGRTARNGREGFAATLLSRDDFQHFDGIMSHYEGEIEQKTLENVRRVIVRRDDGDSRGRESYRDGPRRDGPRCDGPREGSYGGPRRDGPRTDGPRSSGPRYSAPRRDSAPTYYGLGDASARTREAPAYEPANKTAGGKRRGHREYNADALADLD